MSKINQSLFPSTRFQGSKLKLVEWIWNNIKDIHFTSCLDAFGGTGSVSYMFKQHNKIVTYNDYLKFNSIIGKALIENDEYILLEEDINFILTKNTEIIYPTFIEDKFDNIFYLKEENKWLDQTITNINQIENPYKQSLAWFCLFQSCLVKRPYNLFHRANLYIRNANVIRSFGNKKTWDLPFQEHFIKFANEVNKSIIRGTNKCLSINKNIFDIENNYDLIYIDSPYINSKGIGTDYYDFYHFLEGMVNYQNWYSKILTQYKHLPLEGRGKNEWINKRNIYDSFDKIFNQFQNSILVISYRDDGIPTVEELVLIVKNYKKNIKIHSATYQYALSHNKSKEILIVAQ